MNVLDDLGRLRPTCRASAESDISAVFITTDALTIRCLNEWEQAGVRVPEHLSVIGFDNLGRTSSGGFYPPSIGYDDQQLGMTAVHLLEYMLNYPQVGSMSHNAVPAEQWPTGGHHINFFPDGEHLSMNLSLHGDAPLPGALRRQGADHDAR